jgi:hypothetical protein
MVEEQGSDSKVDHCVAQKAEQPGRRVKDILVALKRGCVRNRIKGDRIYV